MVAFNQLNLAEAVLKAAKADDLGDTTEQADLITRIHEEMRSAQTEIEEAEELCKKVGLIGRVLGSLGWIPQARAKVERHKVLLEWIEQQCREMVGGCTDANKASVTGRSERASSRSPGRCPGPDKPNPPRKATERTRKQPVAKSILIRLLHRRSPRCGGGVGAVVNR